ncbi:MAG: alpha/beta fold hydrolase [Anaerolineales bacterium]|nr:alpha/beta fold hydrolase [Anaerolineales bacterium]
MIIPTAEPFFFPGDRTGCLLVHGFTGAPKEMRGLGEHLAAQGRTVLGVRLAAHATRPEDMIRARWQDWLASVEDGWHILRGCCDQVFVMGLSMGGMLTLTFAAQNPGDERCRLGGIVVMAAPHHLPNDPRLRFVKPLSRLQPFMPKGPDNYFEPEAFKEHVCYPVDPTRAYAELLEMAAVLRSGLPRITAPALLIYSHQDLAVTEAEGHMELIYASLGSADKRKLWIENSSHVITCDAQHQQVFQAASDFVDRLSQTRA